MAADGADVVIVGFVFLAQAFEGFLVQPLVGHLDLLGPFEALESFAVVFRLGIGNEGGVHAGGFVIFAGDGSFQVFGGVFDCAGGARVGVGVDGLGGGGSAEQPGCLGMAFFIGLLGEGEIL